MGFTDTANLIRKKEETETQRLRSYAEKVGVELPEQKKSKTGVLGGLQKFGEFVNTGAFASGAVLAKITGKKFRPEETAFEGKILPSEVIFGLEKRDAQTIGESLKQSFFTVEGLLRLGVDIFFDPITYITLGTGAAIKMTTQAGVKVAVSKTGVALAKELAEEVGEKAARQTVASLASIEKTATTLSRGGLQNIKRGLKAAGKPLTKLNVEEVLNQGIKELRKAGGIKFMGKTIVEAEVAKAPFKWALEGIKATRIGSAMFETLEKAGQSMVKLVNRDYGLDEVAIKNKQVFLDSISAAQHRISEQITVIFGGTTKAQREAITLAIEDGTEAIARLSPELRTLTKRVKDIFKSVGKEEETKGLLNSWISDYVTHAYRNVEKRKTLLRTMREGQPSALLRFAKERRIPTIREAEGLGLDPIKDIAEILNIRLVASQKAMLMQDFFKITAITKGIPKKQVLELGESFVRLGDVGTGIPKEFKNTLIPANIADDIIKMERRFFNDEELNFLLRGYDKALNFFKGSVTVMFPAFHGRNAISNVQQNFLDIGIQAMNPVMHKEAVSIMTGADGFLTTKFGTKISYNAIRKLARTKQILTSKITRVDIERKLIESPFKKTTPFEVGRVVGRGVEGEARMVNFITNLKRGFDVDDAAKRVKDFIMDYDNLTLFEKNVLRRFIPFYTWTRKNLAIQIKALVEQPGKQINTLKVLSQIDRMFGIPRTAQEKEFAPDYIKDGMNMLLARKDDDSTFLVGFDIPIEDAFEVFNEPDRKILSMLSPFLKAPIEMATGYNFFRKMQIKEDDSGRFARELPEPIKKYLDYNKKEVETKEGKKFTVEKVDPQKKWIFQTVASVTGGGRFVSTGFIEPMTSLWKMMKGDEKLTIEDKVNFVRFLTGIRAFTIDIEASQKAIEKNNLRELEDILIREGVLGRFEKVFEPAELKNQATPRESWGR